VPQGQAPPAYAPTLLDKVPADALVAVSFHGGEALTEQLGSNAAALKQVEKQLGVSLDDLTRAVQGEGVLYVRPAPLIPEITLAVQSADPAATKQVFDTIVGKLGGAAAKSLPIPGFELSTTSVGDVVLVSTSKTASDSFGSGPGLRSSDRFEAAAKAVGLGDTTSGFAFVDVHGLAPLVQAAAGLVGGSSGSGTDDAVKALASLDFLAVNALTEDGHVRVEGALRTS